MLPSIFFRRLSRLASFALLLAGAAFLAGCASRFSAHVTAFHQWPTDAAGQSYRIRAASNDQHILEYTAYQKLLRAAIAPTGLLEQEAESPARFSIGFQYRDEPTQIIRREPIDPFFHDGWAYPWGWGWGGHYAPMYVAVAQDAARHVLTVIINDSLRANTEVYRATAIAVSTELRPLAQSMPYLMRAVFEDFPGGNGQVRAVQYREEKRQKQ